LFSTKKEKAELNFIETAARQLAPDGVLVVAIQNKFGLKYLSGVPEPNVGISYFGIENNYGPDTIIRFGLNELKGILTSVGLTQQVILFPFPDYHMPVTILNEQAVKAVAPFRVEPFLSASVWRDRVRTDWVHPLFSLERAWESVHLSGATAYLANAFLVIAGKTEDSLAFHRDMSEYAWHYSTDRHPGFAKEKRFIAAGDKVLISSSLLQEKSKNEPKVPLTHHVTNEDYLQGRLWWELLVEIVNRPGWTVRDIGEWAKPWLTALCQTQARKDYHVYDLNDLLPGTLFDYTPLNCVQTLDGCLMFIDREWEVHSSLTFAHVVLHGLFGSFVNLANCAPPAEGTPKVIIQLIERVLGYAGLVLTKDHIDEFVLQEANIQHWVTYGEDCQTESLFRDYVNSAALVCRVSQHELANRIDQLQNNFRNLEEKHRSLEADYQNLVARHRDLENRSIRSTLLKLVSRVRSKIRTNLRNNYLQ
jgi:hypothetical protein